MKHVLLAVIFLVAATGGFVATNHPKEAKKIGVGSFVMRIHLHAKITKGMM